MFNFNSEFKYGDYENCRFEISRYTIDNSPALLIVQEGSLITVCTVYLDDLEEGEVAIKDYSENKGMLDFLMSMNVIKPPHWYQNSRYVSFPITRFTSEFTNSMISGR